MDTGLKGKTILVTGASGGIGLETTKLLASEGANVVIHYYSGKQKAEELASVISQNVDPLICQANLSQEDEVDNMFQSIQEKYGRIDGLVNNAGIWPENDTTIADMTFSQWNNTIAVNLSSIFLCTRAFLKNLQKNKGDYGSVVFIGSTAGVIGEAGHIDYSSSKAALHGFMLTVKNEIVKFARYGRSNIVSPGWTITPMAEAGLADKSSVTRVQQTTALRKVGNASDIANAIVFLLSDKLSHHTSGQNIVISGGMEGRLLYEKDDVNPDISIVHYKK